MGTTDIQGKAGNDNERPEPLFRTPDGLANTNAVLLFPTGPTLPGDWQSSWTKAGWSVTLCGSAAEIPAAVARSVPKSLIALTWPADGAGASAAAIATAPERAIAAPAISTISGGMERRGDFLAHLATVIGAQESDCWALMAIRVDQASELSARLDMTAIFNLEERISARLAAILHENDAYTIWLELGFGVLLRRDGSGQVLELAERICASIAGEPFLVAGQPNVLTVSIGVALPPKPNVADGVDHWFATAHAAQAMAHRHGGNRHDGVLSREYEPIPAERVLIIREWLQEAKLGGNVMLDFQPVLPFAAGVEALYLVHAKLRDHRAPLGGVYRHEYLRIGRDMGAMEMIDRLSLFGAFEALEQERARGLITRLLVPVDFSILDGVPWRWLEAELRRRRHLVDGLIIEIVASQSPEERVSIERLGHLRELGVRVGLSDLSGSLDWVPVWSRLPLDVLRLQCPAVQAVSPELFSELISPWKKQGRRVIVDAVEEASAMDPYAGRGVDYLCGQELAAIGPRLDFEFT